MKLFVMVLVVQLFWLNYILAANPEYVPGEMIVKLKDRVSKEFFNKKSLGVELDRSIELSYSTLYVVKYHDNDIADVLERLENSSEVEYAEPNYIYKLITPVNMVTIKGTPDDPKFGMLWGLNNNGNNDPGRSGITTVKGADIDALKAWEITKGDRRVKIAIIDTGIDYTHSDLQDNIWVNEAETNGKAGVDDDGNGFIDDIHGYDFANNDPDPMDGNGHGTHCAGTIGAVHNNNIGVAGVMGEVTLVPVKFLTDAGSGTAENSIKSIDYATNMNVDIMSNSWGGSGYSVSVEEAIKRASSKGIIFVAAAGNSSTNNDNSPHYPSNYAVENIIAVAAHNSLDTLASFSCYGRSSVLVAAPGENIVSTIAGGGYESYSGTSMATPHVTGVLGLLISSVGRIPHNELRDMIKYTSVPVASYRGKLISGGRINAYNLLTNTRPVRNEPRDEDWQAINVDNPFASIHPYPINTTIGPVTFHVDGAKFIRVKVAKYETEKQYDYLEIIDANNLVVDTISGSGENYSSSYVEGDTIKVKFYSDYSINKWGFEIHQVEVVEVVR